jgi:hypothetical protein
MGNEAVKMEEERAELLRRYLAERDCECPGCRYNLRMLQSGRCPECNMELQLEVRLKEPRLGTLIAGVVAMASGLGFGGLMCVFGLIMTIARGKGTLRDWEPFVYFGSIAVVHAVGLWIWARSWKKVRTMSRQTRILLAAACWVLPVASVIVIGSALH